MAVDTVSAGTCTVMGQPWPVSAILAAVTYRRCFQSAPRGDRWDGLLNDGPAATCTEPPSQAAHHRSQTQLAPLPSWSTRASEANILGSIW
jgi:hypothetical protein